MFGFDNEKITHLRHPMNTLPSISVDIPSWFEEQTTLLTVQLRELVQAVRYKIVLQVQLGGHFVLSEEYNVPMDARYVLGEASPLTFSRSMQVRVLASLKAGDYYVRMSLVDTFGETELLAAVVKRLSVYVRPHPQ